MSARELAGPLLKAVSRSFYLTIRLLPARLREPIGLAYLLARASDTIADSADAPAEVRLHHLAAFAEMIRTGTCAEITSLQREICPSDASECELIARLHECLAKRAALSEFDRCEITGVMEKIIAGQMLDLRRFADASRITALQSAAELDEYTYLVAGCVGEFWTRVCFHHLPRYSALDRDSLSRIGVSFGQGLQLVNILRDMPADLRAGRCYLPAEELCAAGVIPESLVSQPREARPVFDRWLKCAATHLEDGRRYIEAIAPARLRAGCFLPWYLGVKTLRLMREQPPLETTRKVKVPRSTVRAALALALPVAFSNAALERLGAR